MAVRPATIIAWLPQLVAVTLTHTHTHLDNLPYTPPETFLGSAVQWLTNPARRVLFRVHPFLHDGANRLEPTDQTRPVLLPDVAPYQICNGPGESRCGCRKPSTSCAEFVSEYQRPEHRERWDAVVTSFFLDTAKNPLDYIRNPSFQAVVATTGF